jgi:hypothetical protein
VNAEQAALVAEIRRCLRCMVVGVGQPVEALCPKHRRALEAISDPCDDTGCTACEPETTEGEVIKVRHDYDWN